jgi:hypothetical protein
MSIFKVGMPFTQVVEVMRRTGRKAIRSPETLENDANGKVFKVFLQDATLLLKRFMVNGVSELRVAEISDPVKGVSETLKEMCLQLKSKMLELTNVEWYVASKVKLPKYQFLFITGKFTALSPEFDLKKMFEDPPNLEGLANLISTVFNKKADNDNQESSKADGEK